MNFYPLVIGKDEIEKKRHPLKAQNSLLRYVIFLLCFVIVFTWIIPSYVYVNIPVQGESMLPTFNNTGDTVGLWMLGEPDYLDVVVVYVPSLGKLLIKRVIGKAGDTLRVKFDYRRNENYVERIKTDGTVEKLYREDEPYILEEMQRHIGVEWTVAENEIFVAGDNRNDSNDSFSFGPISLEHYIGKVVLVFNSQGIHIFDNNTSKYAA